MNLSHAQAHEHYFGPPSESIDVGAFVRGANELQVVSEKTTRLPTASNSVLTEDIGALWTSISAEEQGKIDAECCVDDLRTMLEDTVQNPALMGHVTRTHDASVFAIYETAETTKRKRKRPTLADPAGEPEEVTALRMKHDAIKLQCWPLTMHAASFIRPPRQPDHNSLTSVKQVGSDSPVVAGDAVLFVTVYNRQSWGMKLLSRTSQHVLLASQTLGDLFEAIPCTSRELPCEIRDSDGSITGLTSQPNAKNVDDAGAVVCMEGVLYGDGRHEVDYAEGVSRIAKDLPGSKHKILTEGPSMHDIKFSSLTIRLHEPYWILHSGECEHFFIFTAIRLCHSSDPPSGFPLTSQITPLVRESCRVCTKVPAIYSIIGDMRLGESPFLICGPCWRWMGDPKDETDVLVVPLPGHQVGWMSAQ